MASPPTFGQAGRVLRRVGIAFSSDSVAASPYLDAFVRGMSEQGLRLDRDYALEVRYAQGRIDRFPAVIGELLGAQAGVIVVPANSGTWAAKVATTTVPIVMAASVDPEETGLVASLSRPGGNITGLSILTGSITAKRLQLLRELLPGATRIVYLADTKVPGWDRVARQVEDAASVLAFQTTIVEASTVDEIDRALAAMASRRPDALLVSSALVFFTHRKRIVDFCAQYRLPASYGYSEAVIDGGLLSYSANLKENYVRAAYFVVRILGGAKPADLPIEQPTRYELFVNKKTADALGITIPQALLARADEVIR